MPNIQTVVAKIGSMRKEQRFVVYPKHTETTPDDFIRVQSDTCYAKINIKTGEGIYATNPNGAYSHTLVVKGKPCKIEPALLERFIAAIPQKGDSIGPGVIVG
jgi:hypothetical protein